MSYVIQMKSGKKWVMATRKKFKFHSDASKFLRKELGRMGFSVRRSWFRVKEYRKKY